MPNLNQIQQIFAPILTPAAPAVVLGSQLYNGMVQSGTPSLLAGIAAVSSGIGMEFSGALAFSMILLSMRRKATAPMVLGIVGVIGYAAFAIIGISSAVNGASFATFVLMSLIAFLGSGLASYMQDARKEEQAELAMIQAETARITAEKNRANAEARLARSGNFPVKNGKLPESYRDWRSIPQEEKSKISSMSTAEIVGAYGINERTARNWKRYAQQENVDTTS